MAKKSTKAAGLTRLESIGGSILFVVYLLVMPLLLKRLLGLIGTLLAVELSSAAGNVIYYYVLFAVTLLVFHRLLGETTSRFFGNLNRCFASVGLSLICYYGANELFYRLLGHFFDGVVNLNDSTIAAQIDAAPRTTAVIVILLAPFVEEVLFRGLVFGGLAPKSRIVAYAASSLLFAFSHVWLFLITGMSPTYLVIMAEYLIPGLVFAWAYDRSGSLWSSFLVHAAVSALAFWSLV